MAAQVVTITEVTFDTIKKVTFDWLSTDAGAVNSTTTNKYTGAILRVVQIPDAAGTQPTDLYDTVVNDLDGADVLYGFGANLSNAATSQKTAVDGLGTVVQSTLTLIVSNAGNAKGGQTILYIG